MAALGDLPEDLLLEALSFVPARDLVCCCRLVCVLWRDLVDLDTLWKRKCLREGYGQEPLASGPQDWRTFYFLCSMERNLIKNPCGEEGLKFWDPALNERNEWRIEELPAAHRNQFPHRRVGKYFVTSQRPSVKRQLITLKDEGYWDRLMDETKPDIVVKDWFHSGCPCRYQIGVELLSASLEVLQEFHPKDVIVEQWTDGKWQEVSYTFHRYPSGVRHILFIHGGQGWYGLRLTNSSVTVLPEVAGW